MGEELSVLESIIQNRRTTKTAKMNGKKIPDELVMNILALADWAPTHGRTEPWRFIVFGGDKVNEFCQKHAELYKLNTTADNFLQANFDKILHNGENASHLVIAYMQRGHLPKIPPIEEICATAAAIENVLLGATAEGIASFWSTGGLTHHEAMKSHLGLFEADIVLGMIWLGYSDEQPEGKRNIPFEHKVKWIS